ncbi:transcriptional regulator [Thermococcus litoralis DSM 5473]|uniref:Transcriptional regulator n=1 Tax=Thermococcus litoralis (strain ATCC 51850 / DSM 5473 / JCM 8560 / NS-C) TaxID=523849 RepID=H3ZQF8_THELN|nr:Lrp/AsnC family transcriptional regulator [Thermococcus litoralis]EHR78167.1 transcriptional regulator [Thermococcus litoralis DSM 5473]
MGKNRERSINLDEEEIKFWKEISGGKLDTIDVKIYLALREDGRLSDTDLANIVGVSVPTARRRRLALQEKGLQIIGLLLFEEFDMASADVIIKFQKNIKKENITLFIKEACENPKVFEVDEYIGEYDLVIKFFDKNFKELKHTIDSFLTSREIIEKYIILPVVASPKLFSKKMTYKHGSKQK